MNYLGFEISAPCRMKIDRYYAYLYNGFSMSQHSHLNAEIMYVESGEGDVFLANDEKIKLKQNCYILLNSQTSHRLRIADNAKCKILNLELRPEALQQSAVGMETDYYTLLQNTPELDVEVNEKKYFLCADMDGNVKKLMQQIHAELTSPDGAMSVLNIQTKLLCLLIAIARAAGSRRLPQNYCVKKALAFIDQSYNTGIAPKDVAAHTGVHPVYLERQIKKHTGKTLLRLIHEKRIAYAKKLMDNTSLPLTDIAYECGFNTRQNFYETFKNLEGTSPKICRERLAKEINRYNRAPFDEK